MPTPLASVFTPGGTPEVTYNPRPAQVFEAELRKFLRNHRGSALTVSGPSKSGKTVIVKRFFPDSECLWMSGGDVKSMTDFWEICADYCGVWSDISRRSSNTESSSLRGGGTGGIPGIVGFSGEALKGHENSSELTESARTPLAIAVRQALNEQEAKIVIDDFHYVSPDVREDLIHSIKWLAEKCKIVLIAVPQEAVRVSQIEPEMHGRHWQLSITSWTDEELTYISHVGFQELNLVGYESISKEFTRESRGAPLLMQLLCLELCEEAQVYESAAKQTTIMAPTSYPSFYKRIADRNVPGVFAALKAGPRSKGQPRLPRHLRSGVVTDIYGAILFGISQMEGEREVSTQRLARIIGSGLREGENSPSIQQVSSALGKMKEIAEQNRGKGDAALDYVDDTLYIADPFLAFYIAHGSWDYPKPPDSSHWA